MVRGASGGVGASGGAGGGHSDGAILRRYYSERDYMTSPEGIMKLVSIVLCIALAVLLLSGGCGGALRAAGGALELAGAAALAVLGAARLLQLAQCAPMAFLFAELTVSAAAGVLLLVTALLGVTLCAARDVRDYIHGVVGLVTAALVTGSAVVTYVSVTRSWDRAHAPPAPPATTTELDV